MDPESEVFAALANPTRRAVLAQLARSESAVGELTARFALTQPAMSQHLAALRRAGLVTDRREGRQVFYRLAPDGMRPVFDWLSHHRAFWPGRVERLKRLLEEMDE